MLRLAPQMLERTFSELSTCGAGMAECVVYWVGPTASPGYVDEVRHPRHTATAGGYDIDPGWIGELWIDLAERGGTVRAQVHTHPGSAFHSSRDDELPLVHTPGYLSLVIPSFARGPVGLQGAHLAERTETGEWLDRNPSELFEAE